MQCHGRHLRSAKLVQRYLFFKHINYHVSRPSLDSPIGLFRDDVALLKLKDLGRSHDICAANTGKNY